MATFLCGFGETKVSEYQIIGTEGILKMDPAFTWNGDIEQTVSQKEKSKTTTFKHRYQIAAEIIYSSDCIRKNKKPEPSGQEGLLDVRIIDASAVPFAAVADEGRHGSSSQSQRATRSIAQGKPTPDQY
ncbi:MAG TPA: hypothetical protein VGN12_09440 [Pirellulales bacterium]